MNEEKINKLLLILHDNLIIKEKKKEFFFFFKNLFARFHFLTKFCITLFLILLDFLSSPGGQFLDLKVNCFKKK